MDDEHRTVENKALPDKTGIFYVKDPAGVLVMWQGKEVSRYRDVKAFVEIHMKGMEALEREVNALVEAEYKP